MNNIKTYDHEKFATKQDLKDVEVELKHEIALVRKDIEKGFELINKDFESVRKDMTNMESSFQSKIEKQSYKTVISLVILIPTIMKILEYIKI